MKIELFVRPDCALCPKVKQVLRRLLAEMGMDYEKVVRERDVKADPSALADMIMLGSYTVPTARIGDKILLGEEILREESLRDALRGIKSKSG